MLECNPCADAQPRIPARSGSRRPKSWRKRSCARTWKQRMSKGTSQLLHKGQHPAQVKDSTHPSPLLSRTSVRAGLAGKSDKRTSKHMVTWRSLSGPVAWFWFHKGSYIHTCIHKHTCIHTCTGTDTSHINMGYTHIHIYICIYTYTQACICVCTY